MIEQAKALLDSLAITFDFPILEFIRNYLSCDFLDKAMPYITLFGEWGAFWIAIALILLCFRKTRKTAWSMGAALILGVIVCNIVLKRLMQRPRPFDFYTMERMAGLDLPQLKGWIPVVREDLLLLPFVKVKDFSFPSGHTIACFEASTVLLIKDKRLGIPAAVIAFLVAFSRLYLYVHYPSDVIFSMFAGILLGLLGCAIVSIIYHFRPEKRGKYQRSN